MGDGELEERLGAIRAQGQDTADAIDRLERRVKELEEPPLVKFKRLLAGAVVPRYQTEDAAGMDLVAVHDATVMPDEIACVGTGLAVELPPGYEAQVRPRSGLALKGVAVANAPGTVDADYRGEIKVIIRNHGGILTIHKGDRIAQLVVARAAQARVVEVDALSDTGRGSGGFGSTGT